MSDSLQPHGLQHARLPCPSPVPRACSNSYPSSQWCHLTISSSFIPFSSCLQFFPASGSFPISLFFASGGQSIGASASASVLPMNIQDWFPLRLTGLNPLHSKGLSRVFSQHHSSKASILQRSAFFMVQLSHLYMTTGKTIADANRDLKCTCTVELVPLWLYYHYRRTCSGLSASHRRKGCLWSWSICSLELRPADPEMYAWEWITFFKSHSVWGWFVMQHSSDSCCLTHLVTGSLKKAIQEWQSLASNMLLETQAFATSLLYYL